MKNLKEMTLLLTGFEAFEGIEENPSQRIVEALSEQHFSGLRLVAKVLPVAYDQADEVIRGLIQAHQPDVVLLIGVAGRTDPIRLERVALNLDDARLVDNCGELRSGSLILDSAPKAYFSTLPLEALRSVLETVGIPVRISNHAGAYLCNHVFFAARHEVETLGLASQVGFIHIPVHREAAEESQLSLAEIQQAITLAVFHFSEGG